MNKILFTLITLTLALPFTVDVEAKTLLETIDPDTKNCNYVRSKMYQPFSGIDSTFPGADAIGIGANGCVYVGGTGTTTNLVKILFTTAITVIIVLTVINIAWSGIQFMTEEASGKKGAAKKRLQDSFIALALGLLSYTIMYTVNKQLVEFSFDPTSIDKDGSIARGTADAAAALATPQPISSASAIEALMAPVYQVNNPGYVGAPGGWVNPYSTAPGAMGGFGAPGSFGAVQQPGTLMGAYNQPTGGIAPGTMGSPANSVIVVLSKKEGNLGEGTLLLNGARYSVRSGPWGNGYLPVGEYTITMGDYSITENGQSIRGRRETKGMYVPSPPGRHNNNIFGYSFNLSDKYDPRTGVMRGLLRIHPDGIPDGTEGCIGVIGDVYIQEQFFDQLSALIKQNGGTYRLVVS